MKREKLIVTLLFFCILLVRFIPVIWIYNLGSKDPIIAGDADPLLYLGGAQEIIATGVNPFNFFPPLNFLFISAFLYFGKGHVILPMIAMAIVGWLTVIAIYLITKILFGEKAALISAIISGLYPNFVFYGITLYAETLTIFWIVYSFLMLLKHFQTSKYYYLLLAGILWGLASVTRAGLHYFSIFIAIVIFSNYFRLNRKLQFKPIAVFLLSTYLTILACGVLTFPIHGCISLDSKNGVASAVHGANRITTPCTDYGHIRGNVFYDINNCGEKWPVGSHLYNQEILRLRTWKIYLKILEFISQEPLIYLKNSLMKLSCFWSPNQYVIHFIKTKFQHHNSLIIGVVCLIISLSYVIVICGGFLGSAMRRDPFRLIFIFFIVFYCIMIFLTVGNSKLRLPMMPLFIIYCSYFIAHIGIKNASWKKPLLNKWIMIIIFIFICNSIYRYREINLSPAEIQVRKLELCKEMGFSKTARYLLKSVSQQRN